MAYKVCMDSSFAQTEQELLQALELNPGGTVVLTSTVRAARAWRVRYETFQRKQNRSGWITPRILAWEPWLNTLWNAAIVCGADTRMLLSPLQELHLWQSVLERDETALQTLSYQGLAELAQQAYSELNRYRITLRQLRGDASKDAEAFYIWAVAFEEACRKSSCLPVAQLEAALANLLDTGLLTLPAEVFLSGFDRMTPSQTLLVEALKKRNCAVHTLQRKTGTISAADATIVCARTLEEEVECAAQWIRQQLFANPQQRIGVIIPATAEVRDHVDATFRAVLAPSSMDLLAPRVALPYEFSMGTAMARMQPVRTALLLLEWLSGPLESEEISWLLVHGSFSSGPLDARATLDRRFHEREFQMGGPVSLAAFQQWLSQVATRHDGDPEHAPLRRTINALLAVTQGQTIGRQRSFAEWREFIEMVLNRADFHLLKAVSSEDYQLLERWNSMLNQLSSLNAIAAAARFSEVLNKLVRLATQTVFALETRNAPVQVLGIPESAGLTFDAVWWLHAQASIWPPRGKAQPFIPWGLQRAAHMPYADPMEDFAFAQRTTRRVLESANNVVISFALQSSDPDAASARIPDAEVILSPLVRDALPDLSIVAADEFVASPLSPTQTSSVRMEIVHEEPAVPFRTKDVRGGVRFLELQAACPFRAFAELRLGSQPLEDISSGLPPAAQGTLLHRVLQKFWDEIGSQKNLLQGSEPELREMLRKHIQTALADFTEHAREPWQKTLLTIEAERMEERVLLWLQCEKERPDFSVVATEDTLLHPELGGISFQCRVDRIDKTQQGHVLLDYKTGPVYRKNCEGERPDQPQLPAYAVLRDQQSSATAPLAGVAFAGLHARNVEFTVVASLPDVIVRTKQQPAEPTSDNKTHLEEKKHFDAAALTPEQMQQQLAQWQQTLHQLAEGFRSGVAIVDPKDGRNTCTYCPQTMLCRIREAEAVGESSLDV